MIPKGTHLSSRRGTPCIDCGRTLRIHPERSADHPGTVLHRSSGRCSGCYKVHRDNEYDAAGHPYRAPVPLVVHGHDAKDPKTRNAARTTQAWLDKRRRRLALAGRKMAA